MSNALKQVFNKDRTFRPKRKFEPGTQRFELHKKAQASLNAGLDLKQAVQLPHGEDLNDWVAVHVVDFFNRINLIYGTISDSCTDQTCPVMSGGPKYEYRWQDEHKYKKPTALSAPKYMSLLMDWIEVQINNENIFPTNVGECVVEASPCQILNLCCGKSTLNKPRDCCCASQSRYLCHEIMSFAQSVLFIRPINAFSARPKLQKPKLALHKPLIPEPEPPEVRAR